MIRSRSIRTLVISFLATLCFSEVSFAVNFVRMPLPDDFTDFKIFDVGVIDFNNDGILDIYTANCFCQSGIFLGDGHGGYGSNIVSKWKLDHDPTYPKLEATDYKPVMDKPGLYIYWFREWLVFETYKTGPLGTVSGTLETSIQQMVEKKTDSFRLEPSGVLPDGTIETPVKFKAGAGGYVFFRPHPPLRVAPDEINITPTNSPLDRIFIGRAKTHPASHQFTLQVKDRHGFAWADYNGDGLQDIYISSGGARGDLDQYLFQAADELMTNRGDHFENTISTSGIIKEQYNRGRQVAWVDYNNDGRLDLYIGNFKTHNQLYRQNPDGTFTDVAPKLGLNVADAANFVWIDANRDGLMDLLMVRRNAFALFVNHGSYFHVHWIGPNKGAMVGKLTVADYDGDGYLDVLYASWSGNTLLKGNGWGFKVVDPTSLGLPAKAWSASFVDFDNDGLPDLHFANGGLYLQTPEHRFVATGLLENAVPANKGDARTVWFDANNDGACDVLVAYNSHLSDGSFKWGTKFFLSTGSTNNWLGVRLVGPTGNREAIGARVQITSGGKKQLEQVGQLDDSHFSQGFYWLHFGLGLRTNVENVKVTWPDGSVRELNNVPVNQTIVIHKDS